MLGVTVQNFNAGVS